VYVAIGAFGVVGGHADAEVPYVFVAIGAIHIVLSFLFKRTRRELESMPPGPMRPTPTGRFRATGWPPSKNPDDYR
jgi:hypothetical protein